MVSSFYWKHRGEGSKHFNAKYYVGELLRSKGYVVEYEHFEFSRNPHSESEWIRRGFGHNYDILATRTKEGELFFHFVEIDGGKHTTKRQRNRDERAADLLRDIYKSETFKLSRIPRYVVKDCMKTENNTVLEDLLYA